MTMTDLFLVDGQPMLVPDGDMAISAEDIVSADSGRDESGALHRFGVRQGLGSWLFSYTRLTREEYGYMESLFGGKDTFRFTYPAPNGTAQTVTAYRSKHDILLHCAATGLYRNYQFRITAC